MSGETTALREFVRDADDAAYIAHATAETPRGLVTELYEPLVEARLRAPVHAQSQAQILGLEDYRKDPRFGEIKFASALSYEACTQALSDDRLSSSFWFQVIGPVWGNTIINMDGTEHRRHRGLISPAFSRGSLERWEPAFIEPAVHGLIDRFEANGSADLYREFTLLFPVYIITEMLALPHEDISVFNSWAGQTVAAFYDMEGALQASKNLEEYLTPLIEERRSNPGDDLISLLATAELDGSRLDTLEIVSFIRLLLPAGGETTARSTASTMLALLRDEAQLHAVIQDRDFLRPAIEEGLRLEPPLTSINRIALDDLELGGLEISRGTVVECALGVANRDPVRWKDPHKFDVHRERQGHVAFAWGKHSCIGTMLAKMEMRVAMTALFDRLPNLRLDPSRADQAEMRGIGLRSPNMVPVVWG